LPTHLSKSHKDLIYKEKHQRTLEIEPVFATIAGEKFHLEHIDRLIDVPGRSALRTAVDLMKEKKDWDNLPSLLIGLKDAKTVLRSGDLTWITRKAGLAGRPDIILECARRVSDTGFELKGPEVVVEIMWQLQFKAAQNYWDAKDTKQALSWAETITELLEDRRHAGGKITEPGNDPRVRPEVIGVLLQLSAVWVTRWQNGKDEDGKVARYMARLLKSPASIQPDSTRTDIFSANGYLAYMVPVLHGLKLAAQILGSVDGLAELTAELEDSIDGQRKRLLDVGYTQTLDGRKHRGLMIYDQLLGPDAKAVVSAARSKARTEAERQ
jgi:hypothetical protein